MTEPVSTAQYFPWDGGAVFVGTAGVFPAHAHQAIQICFLFEGRIRLRPSDDAVDGLRLAIVPSRHSHAMDGSKFTTARRSSSSRRRAKDESSPSGTCATASRSRPGARRAALSSSAPRSLERRGRDAIVELARARRAGVDATFGAIGDERRTHPARGQVRERPSVRAAHAEASRARRATCRRAASGTCSPSRPEWACASTFCGGASSACGSTG